MNDPQAHDMLNPLKEFHNAAGLLAMCLAARREGLHGIEKLTRQQLEALYGVRLMFPKKPRTRLPAAPARPKKRKRRLDPDASSDSAW